MRKLSIALIITVMGLMGCAGYQTHNHLARSSDTVAVGGGWLQTLSRDSMRVVITDWAGAETTYNSGDPAIRAVINMYPDPISNIVVSRETGIDSAPFAQTYAQQVNVNYTSGDNDWWQTVVFIDLPAGMEIGDANILIESIDPVTSLVVESVNSTVEIVPGAGAPNPFTAKYPWGTPFSLSSDHLQSLERSSHYQIDFTDGREIPAAVSVELIHNPDIDNGGVGRAFVVNPTGEIKNIHWADDGTTTKAMILPATSGGFSSIVDFKFYVSGGIEGLYVSSVQAYRQNGEEIFTVAASATAR